MSEQLHRDFGRLEGKVDGQQTQLDEMKRKVDEMHRALMQAQGGWRVMVMVGGASAAVGAFIAKVVGVFWK